MYQDSYREDNVFKYYRYKKFKSCLIAGLGELEIIPLWMTNHYPLCNLDIVEIDTAKKSKYFKSIIYKDIFSFEPTTIYDLIVIDIWYCGTKNYREEIEVLKSKYYRYLSKDGIMSFPMIDMHTIHSYVELQKQYN